MTIGFCIFADMTKVLFILGFLGFVAPLHQAWAEGGKAEADVSILELDNILERSDFYEQRRLSRLDSCFLMLGTATSTEDFYEAYSGICRVYDRYQTDSALLYAKKVVECAEMLPDSPGNRSRLVRSLTMLGKQYETAGMHNQALEAFGKIDRDAASAAELASVYSFYTFIYESLASQSLDKSVTEQYNQMAECYKDSILLTAPDSRKILSEKKKDCGDYRSALDIILPLFEELSTEDASMGPVALEIADIYSRMGLEEQARHYLIISAMSDIVNGKKEYIALRTLGLDLFREGDVSRAYRYLNKALEDATFCKAKIKIEELVPLLETVNEAYTKEKDNIWNIVVFCLALVCMLAIALVIITVRESRQKRAYLELSRQLTRARQLQEETTKEVREASNIKDSYITGLMLECICRIERLDNYRQDLNRKALSGDLLSLQRELKSKAMVDKEWESFYNVFDTTFLSLFPDFIRDFNKLMKDGGKITNCPPGTLTQELRTFALIRLGINSSDKIATLLRYSRSTIYNYRSKARINSLNPAKFEEELMKIQSI